MKDKDESVREEATKKLTDQALLAKIATQDEDWYVRCTAVSKLTDQALLAKIAKNDKCRLIDPGYGDEEWPVRDEAKRRIYELTNPDMSTG